MGGRHVPHSNGSHIDYTQLKKKEPTSPCSFSAEFSLSLFLYVRRCLAPLPGLNKTLCHLSIGKNWSNGPAACGFALLEWGGGQFCFEPQWRKRPDCFHQGQRLARKPQIAKFLPDLTTNTHHFPKCVLKRQTKTGNLEEQYLRKCPVPWLSASWHSPLRCWNHFRILSKVIKYDPCNHWRSWTELLNTRSEAPTEITL